MLPQNKTGRVLSKIYITKPEMNSFSSIEKDASMNLRGTRMRSLRYQSNAERIWMELNEKYGD